MTATERTAAGGVALVVIDMINPMDFDEGPAMLGPTLKAADCIVALRTQADRLGVPVVYVNDNFGQWHSERDKLIEFCLRPASTGREIVRRLAPRDDDFFVMKPMHSGFYATNLQVLLPHLKVSRLILTGIAADICVLFTAADAHMREYELWAPADAVVATSAQRKDWALDIMAKALGAETRPTTERTLARWIDRGQD